MEGWPAPATRAWKPGTNLGARVGSVPVSEGAQTVTAGGPPLKEMEAVSGGVDRKTA